MYLVYQIWRTQYRRPVALVDAGSPEEARAIIQKYYPVEKVISAHQARRRDVEFVFDFAVKRKFQHPKIVAMI